jgi:hypothetical protein
LEGKNYFKFKEPTCFYFVNYENEPDLGLSGNFEIGFGAGAYVHKGLTTSHKLSYAIIFNADDYILHSFRYKYSYDIKLLKISSVLNYRTPHDRLGYNAKLSFKLSKMVDTGISCDYKKSGELSSYFVNMFVELRY